MKDSLKPSNLISLLKPERTTEMGSLANKGVCQPNLSTHIMTSEVLILADSRLPI